MAAAHVVSCGEATAVPLLLLWCLAGADVWREWCTGSAAASGT